VQVLPFEPETLTSYELGFKSTLLDNTLRLNAAVFTTEYKDIQLVLGQCEVPTFVDPDGIAAPCLKPGNVGDADIEGFELEVEWYITDSLLFDASASTLDFEYTRVDPVALTGSPIDPLDMITPYTPETKWAAGLQYNFPTASSGNWMIRFDASYMSEVYADPTNRPVNKLDGYTLMNAVVRWDAPDDSWRIELQGLNISDELYYIDAYDVSASQGTVIAQPGEPSMWNLSFQRNFD
jgi:iron complex outermembrane receptor protein